MDAIEILMIVGIFLGIFLVISWIILPFTVNKLVQEQEETNQHLYELKKLMAEHLKKYP